VHSERIPKQTWRVELEGRGKDDLDVLLLSGDLDGAHRSLHIEKQNQRTATGIVRMLGRRSREMEIAHFADLSKGERKRLDLDKAGRELGNIEDVRNDSLKVVTYNAQRISINSSGSDRARRKRERERRDEPERMIWEMCS
jgi:hypothetical protein